MKNVNKVSTFFKQYRASFAPVHSMLLMLLILSSCSGEIGKVIVKDMVNPDKLPPIIEYITDPTESPLNDLNGSRDFTINYSVEDDPAGTGIASATLLFTPNFGVIPFKLLGSIEPGLSSATVCIPNKTMVNPVFQIIAIDKNSNITKRNLGDAVGEAFTTHLTTVDPITVPTVTSLVGDFTSLAVHELEVSGCSLNQCSASSLKYEDPTNNIFVMVTTDGADQVAATVPISISDCQLYTDVLIQLAGTAAPESGDTAWQGCSEVVGVIESPTLTTGEQTYDVWFMTDTTVEAAATITIDITKE